LGSSWAVSPNILERELHEETVLFHRQTEQSLVLDRTAAIMWKSLKENCRFEKLMSDLTAVFDADPETLGRDLAVFISQLAEQDFIKPVGD
jgi:hypothetical protein